MLVKRTDPSKLKEQIMSVAPTNTNTSASMPIAETAESWLVMTRRQKPTDPTLPAPPKYTSVIAEPFPEDQARRDHIGSTVSLPPEDQAQADGIIAVLRRDFGTPADGAGAAAYLLTLEGSGQVSTDVLLYVVNTVGGGLGDGIRATLLAGGESYLDSVIMSGTYSPLTNQVYAESPDHQSVYEGLRALGGYNAIATLALLPPEAAYEAIQTWAQEDPAGLANSLEELPDENVLDLVRYLKPVVAVRLLYQMGRGDLIAQHALSQPNAMLAEVFKAFDELVAQDEVANPERARGMVLAFYEDVADSLDPIPLDPSIPGGGATGSFNGGMVEDLATFAITQIAEDNFQIEGKTPDQVADELIELLSENDVVLEVDTQARILEFLHPYLIQKGVPSDGRRADPSFYKLFENLGRNKTGSSDKSTRAPQEVINIEEEYTRIANEALIETANSLGLDVQTFVMGPLDTGQTRRFVETYYTNFTRRWNQHAASNFPHLTLSVPLHFSEVRDPLALGYFQPSSSGPGRIVVSDFSVSNPLDYIIVLVHETFHALQNTAIRDLGVSPSNFGLLNWASNIDLNNSTYSTGDNAIYRSRHHESQAFLTEPLFLFNFREKHPGSGIRLIQTEATGSGIPRINWFNTEYFDLYARQERSAAVPESLKAKAVQWMQVISPLLTDAEREALTSAYDQFFSNPSYTNFGMFTDALTQSSLNNPAALSEIARLFNALSPSDMNVILFNQLSLSVPDPSFGVKKLIHINEASLPDTNQSGVNVKITRLTLYSAFVQANASLRSIHGNAVFNKVANIDIRNPTHIVFILRGFSALAPEIRDQIRSALASLGPDARQMLVDLFVGDPVAQTLVGRFYDYLNSPTSSRRGTKRPARQQLPYNLAQSDVIQDASSLGGSSSPSDPAFPVTPESLEFDLHYTDIAIRDAWATLKADASLPADLRAEIEALPADADVGQILAFLDAHQDVPAVANARDSLLDDPMFTQSVSTLRANDWGLDATGRTVVTPDDSVHAGGTKETHYGVDADGKVYIAAEELADADGRVSQITYLNADGTVNRTTTNTYDANGRPATTATTWADTGETRTETYSYDAAGQETGSTASITQRVGSDGQVRETGFFIYDADQQQISETQRGFAADGKLLFEVELRPDGSPAKVIRFEAGVLDAASLETFHALIQDARADGNTAFFDHPGVRQLGALLDLGQAMGLGYADLKLVDISNLGGAFLNQTRLVDILPDVGSLAPGAVDAESLASLQSLFATESSVPARHASTGYYRWTDSTYQIIDGKRYLVTETLYTVPLRDDLDPGNLPHDKDSAVQTVTKTFGYDSAGSQISSSRATMTSPESAFSSRRYSIDGQPAFTINGTGVITLADGTWTPERIELLQSTLQDLRMGNDPHLTLDAAGQEKILLLDDVLQQAALYGITPQDFVKFDPNNLLESEVSKEKYTSFLESLQGVDGVDQAALTTILQDLASKPDIKTVRLLDYILAPVNILTLGAADDARVLAQTLISISKAAGGTILGRPTATVGKEFADDLIRNFDLLGDATKSAKALKVLGPVVGLLFIGFDLYEGITAFKRHKAEGRSDLTLAYDVFLAMGGGPGGAITAAIHMKRENGGTPDEVALAFFAGMFGIYDPDNPRISPEKVLQALHAIAQGIQNLVTDPIGSLKSVATGLYNFVWSFVPELPPENRTVTEATI
jgi:hypothetical protein